tara:strand:+ start:430 stop:807 length:378 start_codon:yes stop_codon:yes gene_type:complete
MYAIVNISGKQFKAEKGSKLCVPKQQLEEGKKLVIEDVLLVHDGKTTQFGSPKVNGAKVTATILDHARERKILVYKKKRRKGYARKNGHRQWHTNIEIQNIQVSKPKAKPAAKPNAKKTKKEKNK